MCCSLVTVHLFFSFSLLNQPKPGTCTALPDVCVYALYFPVVGVLGDFDDIQRLCMA